MSLDSPGQGVLAFVRKLAEAEFPGSVLEPGTLSRIPYLDGFYVHVGAGLTLIELGTQGIPDWQWSVQITSGLAVEIPDSPELAAWISKQNRHATIGKYYMIYGVNETVTVLFETMLWGGYFGAVLRGGTDLETRLAITQRLRNEMGVVVRAAARQGGEIVGRFGGKLFVPSELDFSLLFMLSAGDGS